jgi:hypothetical protein
MAPKNGPTVQAVSSSVTPVAGRRERPDRPEPSVSTETAGRASVSQA